jgi:hypothetical protein
MKRTILVVFLGVTLLLTTSTIFAGFAQGDNNTSRAGAPMFAADTAPLAGPIALFPPMDDQWDLVFYFDGQTPTGDDQLLGCEFVNGQFFITGGGGTAGVQENTVWVFDDEGTLVDSFLQWSSAGWGWRDLAYDGTYLYGSDDYVVDAIDPVTYASVPGSNINGPVNPCRALAYDPDTDHFWSQSFGGPIYEFSRTGAIIYTGTSGVTAAYGMAWDDAAPDGPWLWIYSQDGTPQTTIYQYNPTTHQLTGVSYTVPLIPGSTDQLAGGLAFTNEFDPSLWTMIGVTQGTPSDMIFVLEMYPAGAPGDLEGVVMEAAGSNDPIEGAMVVLGDDTSYTNAQGEYELLDVMSGTHDVTASAFGYNPATETVEILPDSTVVQDFYLTQPIIDVSITSIDIELNAGQQHDEEFTISNLGDGDLEFDIEVQLGGGGPGEVTILVVDDDGSTNNGGTYQSVENHFFNALDDAGYDYDTFIVDWTVTSPPQNGPTLLEMSDYDLVIWFCGETWGYYGLDVLTTADENNLADYLDNGGNLFLSAQDYLYANYPSAGSFSSGQFPYDYLAVTSVQQDYFAPPASCAGVTGSFAAGMSFSCAVPYPSATLWCDWIQTSDTGLLIADGTGAAACQYEGATFKSAFTTLSFEGLVDGTPPSTKAQFMTNLVNWVAGTDAGIVQAPPRPSYPPAYSENPAARAADKSVDYAQVTNIGPVNRTPYLPMETDQPWLEVSPETGTISPGNSETITASFDMPDTAQVGWQYEGDIIIHNNSVLDPVTIPVTVTITGTGISENGTVLPQEYALHQNYPNPFNPNTNIRFDLREAGHVTLAIYNILGQNVATLVDQRFNAGSHQVTFDAATAGLASGVYFYRIEAGQFTDMKKMVLMK